MNAHRIIYGLACVGTIAVGVASRFYHSALPVFLADVGPDALWALMVYFGAGFVFPQATPRRKSLLALAFCFGIEFSQFYHRPWLDEFRDTPLGHLIFGKGFSWKDLVAYTSGVATGRLIGAWVYRILPIPRPIPTAVE